MEAWDYLKKYAYEVKTGTYEILLFLPEHIGFQKGSDMDIFCFSFKSIEGENVTGCKNLGFFKETYLEHFLLQIGDVDHAPLRALMEKLLLKEKVENL